MKIVGHRGAAGLALENTMSSFRAAQQLGVEIIEFDVHTTKDGVLVVCHDGDLAKVSDSAAKIKNLTYAGLQTIMLHNGESVPTLEMVLEFAKEHQMKLVVELKTITDPEPCCALLDRFPAQIAAVASFDYETLQEVQATRPGYRLFYAIDRAPLKRIREAAQAGVAGIDLDYRLLNPLTYKLARQLSLDIMLYTVNHAAYGRALGWLKLDVMLCTNYPQKFLAPKEKTRL